MLLSTPACDTNFKAPSFSLQDVISGEIISFDPTQNSKPFVIAFICNHCPYVMAIVDQLAATANELQEQDIQVFAVMSNNYALFEDDSPENMKLFAEKHNFSFPYLVDEDQSVAQSYGAVCTPDFFGFTNSGELRYRGRIEEVKDAMLHIKETSEAPKDQRPSQGCSIKWK